MAEDGKVKIDKFDGKDYGIWKMQIEDYLYHKKLHEPLEEKKPTVMKDEDWKLLDRQALGVVRLTLAKNVAYNIVKEMTTYGSIKALSNMYEKPSASNKVYLIRLLVATRLNEGDCVADHVNEFNSILARLASVDIKFDDEVQALLLASLLPDSWSGFVTAISNSSGSVKMTFDGVRDSILGEDIRRRNSGESSGSLLSAESRGRKFEKGQNKGRSRSKSQNRGQSKDRKDIVCWNCQKKGHFRNQCTAPAAPKGKSKEDNSANVVEEVEDDDALICCVECSVESWVMDFGASFHATPCKDLMLNFRVGNFCKVRLADDETLDIAGMGDINIRTSFGTSWTLKDASYEANTVADEIESSTLWHIRLGHMSEKGMKLLTSKGKIPELKNMEVGFCEPCVLGKQKRVTFAKSGRTPKAKKLELVHTDVYGPTTVASLGGSRYYVTFIDDSTRKVWVYFLKNKSDVFATFKKWKTEVENQTGLKVKSLMSDNGGEYSSDEFKSYCTEFGIRMIKTIPETPQQNGVAERMNRTLNERAKSMRLHTEFPKMFWPDAVSTAAYLINRGPSSPLGFKIPEEEWQEKEVNLSHLRVFGCVSYVRVKDSDRDKLNPKAKKCIFIGYGSDDMGYHFWDELTKKVVKSRDVTFNENAVYKDKLVVDSEFTKEQPEKEEAVLENITERDLAGKNGSLEYVDNRVPVTPQTEVRKSSRSVSPPQRYSPSAYYMLLTEDGEPQCYSEAVQVNDSVQWKSAMDEEMSSLEKNETWSLIELPAGKKALHNKWVFRIKEEHDGSKRYKASIVAAEELHLEQLDVKTAFLHGDLEEDIYMVQPEGFQVAGKENLVCKLIKSLYGLNQAPRQWYLKFDSFMMKNGYTRSVMDHCCYFKQFDSSYIILLLYVDDILIAGSNMREINRLKRQMSEEFEMKDMGAAKQILGMSIIRDRTEGTLKLSQDNYVEKLLQKFSVQDAKTRSTPLVSHFNLTKKQSPKMDEGKKDMAKVPYASAVGSLMYAMVCTRPDIAHAVGVVSRFMSNPGREHWEAVKWLLRYLKGTSKVALCFSKKDVILEGFSDADLGGCLDTRKSTTGYIFTLGGTAVSWMSRLQKSVALSTTEAEYMDISEASKEMIWLKNFLEELGKKQADSALYSDSQSAIHLAKNPVFHARTKHIQLRYHFIRELISNGTLSLKKILGSKNPADMLTKVVELPMLHPEKFVKLGIDPPRGVLFYGPPGTGKTLLARVVANRTDAYFIRLIGSELVQKYVGEGARIIRELFQQMARSKKACIVFFDEIDAIGGARFDDGVGGDNEVKRTMLEIINQLDGFDARGNIKVLMTTNRPDTLDPALLRPGRLDRKVEFGLPNLEIRTQMFKIHTRVDIRSVCTAAGMYAIRARRKTVTEKDFLDVVNKVIKGYQKFIATTKLKSSGARQFNGLDINHYQVVGEHFQQQKEDDDIQAYSMSLMLSEETKNAIRLSSSHKLSTCYLKYCGNHIHEKTKKKNSIGERDGRLLYVHDYQVSEMLLPESSTLNHWIGNISTFYTTFLYHWIGNISTFSLFFSSKIPDDAEKSGFNEWINMTESEKASWIENVNNMKAGGKTLVQLRCEYYYLY
ncbi:hypothetical protein AgCh_034456 [Apium graveolens]